MKKDDILKLIQVVDAMERLNVLLKQLTSVGYEEGAARDLDLVYEVLLSYSKKQFQAEPDRFYTIIRSAEFTPEVRLGFLFDK